MSATEEYEVTLHLGGGYDTDGIIGEKRIDQQAVMIRFDQKRGMAVKRDAQTRSLRKKSDLVDFFDAADVAAAFERGGEPDADDVQRFVDGDGAFAEGKDVGVVV